MQSMEAWAAKQQEWDYTPHEAEIICSDLKAQGWKVAYKQPSELMVNHVAPGSLHKEN